MIIQKMDATSSQAQSEAVSTRSGRVVKKPVVYIPTERVEDDYTLEDYDTNDPTDVSSTIETDSDEEDDESDADEYGNLDGFVVPDKSESDCESTDGQSSLSSASCRTARTPTKRDGRPARAVEVPATPVRRSARRPL